MNIFGRIVPLRTLLVLAAIALLVVAAMVVPGCVSKWRSEHAQSRVDAGQASAAANSAADAIGTVTASGARETASEELTRSNERDIRSAPGAGERVNAGVNAAGLQALCRRDAYRNSERCKIFRKEPVR